MTQFDIQDHYFLAAKKAGYKARSVFKLAEINQRVKLIKKNSMILDLGCAPGSWMQYVAQNINSQGAALGVDLTEVNLGLSQANIQTIIDDCFMLTPEKIFEHMHKLNANFNGLDVLLSDMAPKTSGIKHVDQTRSLNLSLRALGLAQSLLKPGGHAVIKIFNGGQACELISQAKQIFTDVKHMRPKSIRSESKEFYVVGLRKK